MKTLNLNTFFLFFLLYFDLLHFLLNFALLQNNSWLKIVVKCTSKYLAHYFLR